MNRHALAHKSWKNAVILRFVVSFFFVPLAPILCVGIASTTHTTTRTANNILTMQQIDPADYPTFLACADLGVSLHTSTSGRDLPIKILDYFGCEVPVAAFEFDCLHELVQDDVNGRTFTTSEQLSQILWQLLSPLAAASNTSNKKGVGNHDFGDLKRFSLQIQGRALWSESWPKHAQPLIEGIAANASSAKMMEDDATKRKDE